MPISFLPAFSIGGASPTGVLANRLQQLFPELRTGIRANSKPVPQAASADSIARAIFVCVHPCPPPGMIASKIHANHSGVRIDDSQSNQLVAVSPGPAANARPDWNAFSGFFAVHPAPSWEPRKLVVMNPASHNFRSS